MSLDKTIALVDTAEVKLYLDMDPDIDTREEYLESLINAASQFLENHCNTKFITPSTNYDEIFDGNGRDSHYVKYRPLTTTISTIYWWQTDSWEAYNSGADFTQDDDKGLLYFRDGNIFHKGTRNWKISYKYGYERRKVPADLKEACIDLILLNKRRFDEKLQGMTGKSFDWGSISFDLSKIPANVIMAINKYKRFSY